jgi:hypothetical protein
MARNFRELQDEMDPASRSDNKQRALEEAQRIALEEPRSAQQRTEAKLADPPERANHQQ